MILIHHSTLGFIRWSGVALLLALVGSACSLGPSSGGAGGVIDREVFIQTYVDLRVAALETETQLLSDEARTEVLARHGTTAADLMRFAEANGRELEFMRDVWNDVEARMDALRPDPEG